MLWRALVINAATLPIAALALAFSPATVSFPIALTEGLVLGGGLAATFALHLLMLRPVFASARAATDHVRLTRLSSASVHHSRPWDWLLELDVGADEDVHAGLESPSWCEWLGGLLGMRPAVMVAAGGRRLSCGER